MEGQDREHLARERLLRVLVDFPVLYRARHGLGTRLLNPFEPLEKVARAHVNPLLLLLNELTEKIRKGLSYLEALERVVLFSLSHPRRDVILNAVEKVALIEGDRPYFLWGLAHLRESQDLALRERNLRDAHRKLYIMNRIYREKLGASGDVDLIPWKGNFLPEASYVLEGTYKFPTRKQLELFRSAIHSLEALYRDRSLERISLRILKRNIQRDIEEIARLLFGYGFTVEEICGRLSNRDSMLAEFLNGILLEELEKSWQPKMGVAETSKHVVGLTLMDFPSVVLFRSFYCRPSRHKEARELAKEVEKRFGSRLYLRVLDLYQSYKQMNPPLLAYYLEYRFQKAFGDYLPARGPQQLGVEMSEKFVFTYFNRDSAEKELKEEVIKGFYSSKTSQEILELLRLIMCALERPDAVHGGGLQILGHIESGAMGRVLLGVYKDRLVALKDPVVPPGSKMPLSEKIRRLEYEARIHCHVQPESAPHENIVECFGLVREERTNYLAIGYHPAEHLGSLMKRMKAGSGGKANGWTDGGLSYGEIRLIGTQLLRALIHLREKQVIHRDLKPANILYLVDRMGRASLIKVIDFGVALGLGEGMPPDMFSKQVVGTMAYMAPEAATGNYSYASDLYSIGVILYQLMSKRLPLTLERPRSKDDLRKELRRVAQERRVNLLDANPALKKHSLLEQLSLLVQSMIRMDPTARPPVDLLLRDWEEVWSRVPEEFLELLLPLPP